MILKRLGLLAQQSLAKGSLEHGLREVAPAPPVHDADMPWSRAAGHYGRKAVERQEDRIATGRLPRVEDSF